LELNVNVRWIEIFTPRKLSARKHLWTSLSRGRPAALLAALVIAIFTFTELRYSWFESHILAAIDSRITFWMQPGASPGRLRRETGPYDQRLGFSDQRNFIARLEKNQYEIAAQARVSNTANALIQIGLAPIYEEKNQAGLRIKDDHGRTLLDARHPSRVYPDFLSIPPLIINTLLFIENRHLQDGSFPDRNPAIEWERLGKAVIDLGIHTVDRKHAVIGGSTLATQLEKIRHSPGGRTGSVREKVRQMASASFRSYLYGSDTRSAQRRIICDYINSIPLAATPAQGEVIGLGDGLRSWYGADFDTLNQILSSREDALQPDQMVQRARSYRQVLSLFLALRAPSWYLVHNPDALEAQTDRYLRLLASTRVISSRLRDLALSSRVRPMPAPRSEPTDLASAKATNAIRSALLPLLGLDNPYALDRLDLDVSTTLDKEAQNSATRFLKSLSDPARVAAAGLNQYQLLDRGNPQSLIYSVSLYERRGGANLLRVQTDNFDQPLDVNQGTKLQLGSTAKLRILIHYLEIVSELHQKFAIMSPEQLRGVPSLPGDKLTQWALSYLSMSPDKRLQPMLEAALQRKYSGNPDEAFFTAGGLQVFENFESSEDLEVFTVSQGFQRSVNLVFIRLFRDMEHYHRFRVPGAPPNILTDPYDPRRIQYLTRFADLEGRLFLKHFYERYKYETGNQALEALVSGIHLTPVRAAVIYRSVRPRAGIEEFRTFLQAHLPASELAKESADDLYSKYGPDNFNLQDRGYLAHVHPLELLLLNYREQHPQATLTEIYAQSTKERQQVYQWLLKIRFKHAQDVRIETLLEMDSFQEIHSAWQRLGYPFDSLVPSYATAIGVSGDTPAALAKLVGIILNDGVLYPSVSIQELHFGAATPAETILTRRLPPGNRLLDPVIARIVRREMIGVVENGTGRRLHGGLKLSDGTMIPVGGKTGTGDNEFRVYGSKGGLLGSRVVNRTAAFAFFIGDRFFGTILAFVPGKQAAEYEFTSALAVQVLKDLSPVFLPLIDKAAPTIQRD
jgi:membrane peptidoglycan carboxypeptidase